MTIYTINRNVFPADVVNEIGDREFILEDGRVVPLEGDLTDIYMSDEDIKFLNQIN